jgi:hypothetical protein
MIGTEQRAFTRNKVEAPLQFKMPETEELAVTRLLNFCQGGIYFESHLPLVPDYETTIVMPDLLSKSPTSSTYACYSVRIRWCNKLKKLRDRKFGIGAQLLNKVEDDVVKAKSLESNSTCDLCDQSIIGGSVCRIEGAVCLCLPCYKHLEGLPEGPARQSILKYINRSVL